MILNIKSLKLSALLGAGLGLLIPVLPAFAATSNVNSVKPPRGFASC